MCVDFEIIRGADYEYGIYFEIQKMTDSTSIQVYCGFIVMIVITMIMIVITMIISV